MKGVVLPGFHISLSEQKRLWSYVTCDSLDACWTWQGHTEKGYGVIGVQGGNQRVHRVVFQLFGSIPAGLVLDHLCRNRACCNPAHLEAVTCQENVLRGEGSAAINAKKTHCKRGHALSGENLYINKRGHRECVPCKRQLTRDYRARDKAQVRGQVAG